MSFKTFFDGEDSYPIYRIGIFDTLETINELARCGINASTVRLIVGREFHAIMLSEDELWQKVNTKFRQGGGGALIINNNNVQIGGTVIPNETFYIVASGSTSKIAQNKIDPNDPFDKVSYEM